MRAPSARGDANLANPSHMSNRKFIDTALLSNIRVDGRRPFDYRQLIIKFGREDGSSEIQLGETHVMGYVTGQLVQPYRDRPNEGALSIFTEFSPMADPAFETGRPGESAVELGRIVDRGLRESRAVDMESLCVVAGKSVWAIRVDLHILDNGGNLIDAANVAALAALLTYRRPECTVGGENGQDVIIHDPEVREPLPLIIHHIPVAVTFGFFNEGDAMVIDPTHKEEFVMGSRMTATLNSNGDVCAVQKAGGEGVSSSVIMHCLRLASLKAVDITSKIKNAVDSYNTERALRKVKRHSFFTAPDLNVPEIVKKENQINHLAKHQGQKFKEESERVSNMGAGVVEHDAFSFNAKQSKISGKQADIFLGGPSHWDPYSEGISTPLIRNLQVSPGVPTMDQKLETQSFRMQVESNFKESIKINDSASMIPTASLIHQPRNSPKSLKDAVKPKIRKKKHSSSDVS
ncbi:hypothetical protein AXF42_Ash008918 [Apostasia shenzhenica]|uniref:Protein ECERIFERUM 7 n=1 Tax=Apostasia shenzhenica TaxID=1088818 RepID=A0A2I0ASV5_9ASPA|nr:hypothetical protein AXF42_Ash008918 [Apostasia shenzhenica]